MTLGECLRRAAGEAPEREAYVYRGQRLSYSEWHELSGRAAANLVERGAGKGDRVALLLPPRPEYAVAYLAAAKAGLITAGVNPRLADPEIAHVLADSGARFVVAIDRFGGRELARLVESLAPELPELDRLFVVDEGTIEWSPRGAGLGESNERREPFSSLFVEPSPDAPRRRDEIERGIVADDPVAIVYTSGTTGKPKGALFALRNLEAVARTRAEMGMRQGERVLAAGTPFAHLGYMTKIMSHIEDRQTTVVLDTFNARSVLETVQHERISHLGGVPTQWSLLLLDPEFDRFDLSTLRGGAIGGAPFTPELVRDIRRRFGIDLVTRYSCTEIALGTGSRPDDSEELLAETVGRAGSEVELAIVDENRRPLPVGEVGEVAVRSPAVMVGYWRSPDETAAVLDPAGWYYTGDLGVLDQKGYLRLRGRKKEMYIRGGYNVYPVEVESVLARHPDIAQVAVVGVPDPVLGEKGLAVVVLRQGRRAPSLGELRAFSAGEVADYKAPDFVEIRAELPMNAMYKVDKNRLREEWKRSVGNDR